MPARPWTQKFYAGSQVIDEVRHVEVLSKFLQRKMGTLHPIDPTLKILLDMLLEAPTWKLKTLGMQTLFEGMAVGIFDTIAKATTHPLLRDIIRRVQIDESRHAAFGVLSMRQVVRESSAEEIQEMEDFAFSILEALNANQQLDMLRLLGPKYGLDPENVVQSTLSMPEWPALNSEIFMHTVMPNPMRLGLHHRAHRSRLPSHGDDPRRPLRAPEGPAQELMVGYQEPLPERGGRQRRASGAFPEMPPGTSAICDQPSAQARVNQLPEARLARVA